MHYHGTPISPRSALFELAGRNFCISFAKPQDVGVCHRIGQSVMLDNGAFSVWRRDLEIDWKEWHAWAEPWLDTPTTWAVLPDSIEGGEEDNDALLREWKSVRNGVPVWHLHESLERLSRIVDEFGRVCFGSSGTYSVVGSDAWHQRVTLAFNVLVDDFGRVPWVHMLRGMSLVEDVYPFASLDSTDIGRNHNRQQNTPLGMANRWDGLQCPSRWSRVEQLTLGVT